MRIARDCADITRQENFYTATSESIDITTMLRILADSTACYGAVSVCLSVCPSHIDCVETAKPVIKQTTPWTRQHFHTKYEQMSLGDSCIRGVKWKAYEKCRFHTKIQLYPVADYNKHVPRSLKSVSTDYRDMTGSIKCRKWGSYE